MFNPHFYCGCENISGWNHPCFCWSIEQYEETAHSSFYAIAMRLCHFSLKQIIFLSLFHRLWMINVSHAFTYYSLVSFLVSLSSGLSPLYSPVSFCGAPLGPNQKRIQDLSLNSMIGTCTHSHPHMRIVQVIWHTQDPLVSPVPPDKRKYYLMTYIERSFSCGSIVAG